MMKSDTKHVSALQDSAPQRTDHAFKMGVLPTLTAKFVMTPEELPSASNVSHQPTEFWPSHNINASAEKASSMMPESASPANQVVPSVQTPHHVKDALCQPPTTTTELVPVHKVISSPLSH
jgi:hypothetical protein